MSRPLLIKIWHFQRVGMNSINNINYKNEIKQRNWAEMSGARWFVNKRSLFNLPHSQMIWRRRGRRRTFLSCLNRLFRPTAHIKLFSTETGRGADTTIFSNGHRNDSNLQSDLYLYSSDLYSAMRRKLIGAGGVDRSVELEFLDRFHLSCSDRLITSKDWSLVKRMVKLLEKQSNSSASLSWLDCLQLLASFCRYSFSVHSLSNNSDQVLCFVYRKSIEHALANCIQWDATMLDLMPDSCTIETPLLFAIAKLQRLQNIDQPNNTHLLNCWIKRFRSHCPQHLVANQDEIIETALRIASNPFPSAASSDHFQIDSSPLSSNPSNVHIHNIDYYTSLLQECLKNDDRNLNTNTHRLAADEILRLVHSLGLKPSLAYNHLALKYYFRVGQVAVAKTLFEEMAHSHLNNREGDLVKTLNCVLNGLFINGLFDEAFQFYEDKFGPVYQATPSVTTMTIIIKHCVERGLYNVAERYYEQAQQMQIPFSIIGWESILRLLTIIDMKRAKLLFSKLKNDIVNDNKPIYITNNMYLYMIRGYIQSKDYRSVLSICREMQSKRRYRIPLQVAQYAITAQAFLEPDRPEKALAIYHIYRKKFFSSPQPSHQQFEIADENDLGQRSPIVNSSYKPFHNEWVIPFYTKLLQISLLRPHENQLRIALNLYNDACKLLQPSDQKDAPSLMHFLVSSYARAGDAKKAWMWFRILDDRGYRLPSWTLDDLVRVLVFKGRREKIRELSHIFLLPQDDGSSQPPTTELMNGLLYCNLKSLPDDFQNLLSAHDQVSWNGQTFALVLQYYASHGNFLLSWNMWLKYVEWVDDPYSSNKNKGKMQLRVVRTIVSWCVVFDKPLHLIQVWREAMDKNRIDKEDQEKLYDIQFIEIPGEFQTSRDYITHVLKSSNNEKSSVRQEASS